MNVIIPIGGTGQRFQNEKYLRPKPLIHILGKPMIFWVLENIHLKSDDVLMIIYHQRIRKIWIFKFIEGSILSYEN